METSRPRTHFSGQEALPEGSNMQSVGETIETKAIETKTIETKANGPAPNGSPDTALENGAGGHRNGPQQPIRPHDAEDEANEPGCEQRHRDDMDQQIGARLMLGRVIGPLPGQ